MKSCAVGPSWGRRAPGVAPVHSLFLSLSHTHPAPRSVFAWLCCSREEVDSHRFARTLQAAIDAGELAAHSRFAAWAKRVARKPEPAVDPLARKATDGGGGGSAGGGGATGDDSALVAAIRARTGRAASFLTDLEKRYGGGGKGTGNGRKKRAKKQ